MSYKANDKEIAAVSRLPAAERYGYFIRKIADWREVWGIGVGDSWRFFTAENGEILVPAWPAEAYARLCCIGDWAGCSPKPIPLDDWLEKWIPGMLRDNRRVAAFPLPNGLGIPVDPNQVADDIRNELANFLDD